MTGGRKRRSCIDRLHPAVAAVYFCSVIILTMLMTSSPIGITVSFAGAVIVFYLTRGKHALGKTMLFILPLVLLLTLTDTLISHRGNTVLFYLNGAAITAEAMASGFFTGLMIASVGLWFFVFGETVTGDKIYFLFGRKAPKFALLFSMTVGFVPKLIRRYGEISRADRGIHGDRENESFLNRIKYRLYLISALVTLSLERAMDTADSMKARGYGAPGRTCYAEYRMTVSDIVILCVSLSAFSLSILLTLTGGGSAGYYPTIPTPTAKDVALYITLAILTVIPIFAEVRENLLWRMLNSKM